jgi:hypothetical protein
MSETAPNEREGTSGRVPAVAAVLGSARVVINIGSTDGVLLNDAYLLYEVSDDVIIDPITQEELGLLEIPKGTGVVVHVQPRLATLQADSTRFREPQVGDRVKKVFL